MYICRYLYHIETKFEKILKSAKLHCYKEPIILDYNRFEPSIFEQNILSISNEFSNYDEIFIDISVMSKMLIMIILFSLKQYNGTIRVIYSEPELWGPAEEKYISTIKAKTDGDWISLSSLGISDVVRTPNLSSVIMQNSPVFLVSFYSFNELLLGALINEISPSRLQLISHSCERQSWRENAMNRINSNVIKEHYSGEMEIDFSANVLDYSSVFQKISEIYRKNCYEYRIIIAPTGGKIHAVACALMKLCCPDIHIEYPTPESYIFEDYSSEKTYTTHQIVFENFNDFVFQLSNEYGLNG